MSTKPEAGKVSADSGAERAPAVRPLAVAAWVWVGVPFCYGLYQLVAKIPALFGG